MLPLNSTNCTSQNCEEERDRDGIEHGDEHFYFSNWCEMDNYFALIMKYGLHHFVGN